MGLYVLDQGDWGGLGYGGRGGVGEWKEWVGNERQRYVRILLLGGKVGINVQNNNNDNEPIFASEFPFVFTTRRSSRQGHSHRYPISGCSGILKRVDCATVAPQWRIKAASRCRGFMITHCRSSAQILTRS